MTGKHLYRGDGITDWLGHDRCVICRCPQSNDNHHDPPEVSEDVKAAEARRYGEREEDE